MTDTWLGGGDTPHSYLTQIRNVALLPEEVVSHLFCPSEGITSDPPAAGQCLVATNRRILAFSLGDDKGDAFIAPLEDLRGVSLKSSARTPGALVQGILFIIAAIFIYLALAYWLTGRVQGPTVPVINMDVGTLLVLVAVLVAAVYIARHYFTSESGLATFQGTNWTFSFPYNGETPEREIYQVVNSLFAARGYGRVPITYA